MVLKNKKVYDQLSKNGIATAQTFDWDKSVIEFENLLHKYLGY
jgi:hypothetical protein